MKVRYSRTVMSAYSGAFSGRYPIRRRTSAPCSTTSSPSTVTVPEVADRKPVMIFMQVVFPAPFGPRKPTISPSRTSNETPCSARIGP